MSTTAITSQNSPYISPAFVATARHCRQCEAYSRRGKFAKSPGMFTSMATKHTIIVECSGAKLSKTWFRKTQIPIRRKRSKNGDPAFPSIICIVLIAELDQADRTERSRFHESNSHAPTTTRRTELSSEFQSAGKKSQTEFSEQQHDNGYDGGSHVRRQMCVYKASYFSRRFHCLFP